jgi:hypothetical protein
MHPRHAGGRLAYLARFFAVINARLSKTARACSHSVCLPPSLPCRPPGGTRAPGRAGSAARDPAGGSAGRGWRPRPSWPPSPWPAVRPLSPGKPAPGLPFPRLSGIGTQGKYRHRGHLTESPARTGAGCQFGPMAPPARFRRSARSAGPRGPLRRRRPAGAAGRPGATRRRPRPGPDPASSAGTRGSGPPSAQARPGRLAVAGPAAVARHSRNPRRRPQGARRAAVPQCPGVRAARPAGPKNGTAIAVYARVRRRAGLFRFSFPRGRRQNPVASAGHRSFACHRRVYPAVTMGGPARPAPGSENYPGAASGSPFAPGNQLAGIRLAAMPVTRVAMRPSPDAARGREGGPP